MFAFVLAAAPAQSAAVGYLRSAEVLGLPARPAREPHERRDVGRGLLHARPRGDLCPTLRCEFKAIS